MSSIYTGHKTSHLQNSNIAEIQYMCTCIQIFNVAYTCIDIVLYFLVKLSTDIQTYNL